MIVNQKSIISLRLLTDLILLNICFLISAIVAQSLETLIARNYIFLLLLIQNLLWRPTALYISLYDEFNLKSPLKYIFNVFKITTFQAVLTVFFIFILKEDLFTRIFLGTFTGSLFVLLILKEIIIRKVLKLLRKKGINVKNAVIIGNNENAVSLEKMIEKNPQLGFKLLGFIENPSHKKNLGKIDQFEEILIKNKIDVILTTIPSYERDKIKRIIRISDRLAVSNIVVPDYSQFLSGRYEFSFLDELPIVIVRNNKLEEVQIRMIKRAVDLSITLFLFLTIFWWLFPIISLLIKFDSTGPIFFIQKRIGYKNKEFNCYKFRSMTANKGNHDSTARSIKKQISEVTKVGRFLRKSNLDELPQFINVLKGDMSLVGPRPHAIAWDKQYSDMVEEIRLRHRVKPGITGWAQVHKLRGDVEDPDENRRRTIQRIEHDIWYIENWTFFLDIQISIKTFTQTLGGKNQGV